MTFGILSDWPGTSAYHKDILRGIEDYGRSAGINILTFAVGPFASELPLERGRRMLYEVLRGHACDGLIVYTASVGAIVGADLLFRELNKVSRCPKISLSVPHEGCPSVVIDNRSGFVALCRHLIHEHGYRDILFLSGEKENYDSERRLAILREVAAESGLKIDEDRIWYGDFSARSGSDAFRYFVDEKGLKPQAIICANDYLAIGAWEEAKKHGLLLPWDMAITGFDNIVIGRNFEIPFTTVDQPFYQQGHTAARLLHDAINGRSIPVLTELPSKLVLRESCGCLGQDLYMDTSAPPEATSEFLQRHRRLLDDAFQRFLDDKPGDPLIRAWQVLIKDTSALDLREAELLRFFDEVSADFSSRAVTQTRQAELVKNLLQMQRILSDYYKEADVFEKVISGGTLETMMKGVESFAQWLTAARDIQSQSDYLKDMFASLGVKNAWLNLYANAEDAFSMPGRTVFRMIGGELRRQPPGGQEVSLLDILPEDPALPPWLSLIVEALYEGSHQLGILAFDNLMWDSDANEMLRRRLSSALRTVNITRHLSETNDSLQKEILRRRESEAKLSRLMVELKRLSIKDELTGLFNRRGFLTIGERQTKYYIREKKDFLILFADVDGLKKINDTWGHREGDLAIQAAARVLETSCRDADIVARLGGDEFTVLLGSAGPQHEALITERIEKTLMNLGFDGDKEYRLSLSLGFVAASEYPGAALRELLDYADRKLYEMKKVKKQDRLNDFHP